MKPKRANLQIADTALIRSVAKRLMESKGVEEGLADILPLLIRFLGSDFGAFLVRRESGWIVVGRGADEALYRTLPRTARLVARATPIVLPAVPGPLSKRRGSRDGSPDSVALPVHGKRGRVGYGVFRTGEGAVPTHGTTLHLLDLVGAQVGAFCENAFRCEQAENDKGLLFRANEELGCLLRFNESLHAIGDADSMFKWLSREIRRFAPVLGIEMVSLIGRPVLRVGCAPGTKVPAGKESCAISRKCSETLARHRIDAPAAGFKVKRFECLAASDSDRPGTARRRVETPLLHAGQVVGFLAVEMPAASEDSPFIDRLIASVAGQIGLFLHNNADREKIRSLADRDALTGLCNYRSFQETFDREFERFRRHGRNMSLMMIDLDNFKRINDTFGHQAGDHALCEVARILLANLRKTDYAFRYGGDEFVVLMTETDAERAAVFAQRIRAAVKREVRELPQCEFSFSTSIGIADCSRLTSGDRGELLHLADAALYLAKDGGRDRTQLAPDRLAGDAGNVESSAPRFLHPLPPRFAGSMGSPEERFQDQ